jgi:hypothetical protein
VVNVAGKTSFLGAQKNEIELIRAAIPAIIAAGRLTIIDLSLILVIEKKFQKYRVTIAAATKKAASQTRRRQKRFNAIGLMMPPNFRMF